MLSARCVQPVRVGPIIWSALLSPPARLALVVRPVLAVPVVLTAPLVLAAPLTLVVLVVPAILPAPPILGLRSFGPWLLSYRCLHSLQRCTLSATPYLAT